MAVRRGLVVISLVAALVIGSCTPITAPVEAPTAPLEGSDDLLVVWRGFTHSWTHNHRWNRFGNWVEPVEDCAGARCYQLGHSAASGTSGDAATFTSHYTTVEAPDVGFALLESRQRVRESYGGGGLWTVVGTARIPEPEASLYELQGREHYTAILNGWDLFANPESRAAKPIDFGLDVSDPVVDAATGDIIVPWRLYLRMNCTTEECPASDTDPTFDYTAVVYIGVFGYEDGLIVQAPERVAWNRAWNAPKNALGHGNDPAARELLPEPQQGRFEAIVPGASNVVAIRRVMLHLYQTIEDVPNADQHMLEWRSTVAAAGGASDAVEFEADLLFKNWTEGMNRYQAFAYKDAGAALMTMDVVLLQFLEATSWQDGQWSGGHWWEGGDANAAGATGVTRSSDAEGGQ